MERLFGLIGQHLSHSFSKRYFTEKFEREGILARYELFELPDIAEFPALIRQYALSGLNVTIPYKSVVIPFLDQLSPEAKAVGAVNTIRFGTDGLMGFNTDTYGFQKSVEPFVHQRKISRALVLGTGGASKAVAYVLEKKLQVECRFVSRQPKHHNQYSYIQLNEVDMNQFPLIVNTTPLGMYPETEAYPDIPYASLTPRHLVYDLIYNPAETRLMKMAAQKGAATLNGMDMLVLQAEAAWRIWNAS